MPPVTCKVTVTPKGARKASAAPAAKPHVGALQGLLTDINDQVWTFQGVDKQGAPTDISAVAVPTAKSSDPTICTFDAAQGQTINAHYLLPGTITVTFTETWNDGSIGPINVDVPLTISGSAATGFTVTPGLPVVRP